MLCAACRVHLRRDFPYCLHCGTPRRRVSLDRFVAPLLIPLDAAPAEPVPLQHTVTTIGRDRDNDIVLGDPSVSRQHARIVRREGTFAIEDLRSLNGIRVGGRTLHGLDAELVDGAVIEVGDVRLRFDQPRPYAIGGRTVHGAEHTVLRVAPSPTAPEATEPLSARPRKRSGWALKRAPGADERWVLSSRTGTYLQLDAREAFIFGCVDGVNTVRDLLFRYAEEFGELALPRIERALRLFEMNGLVDGLAGAQAPPTGRWRRAGRAFYHALLKLEISIGGLDGAVGRLYRAAGWRAFTRTGGLLTWAVVAVGLWAFFRAKDAQRLFTVGGAGWWGALIVGVGYLIALIVHELAHALAVKSYGRSVRRGGFMVMMGMPFAFVDTSDMWFGTRWSRVVVAMSGPISTAALAGVAAMGALWLPGPIAPALCFQLAFGLYLNTAYNFNPVMPLDGYQALTDAFRIPRLREQASHYFTRGLWQDIAARRRPRAQDFGLALYGLAVVVGGYVFLVLGLIAWRHRLGPLVHRHVAAPWDSVVLGAAVVLLTFPVWARLANKVRGLARRRRDPSTRPTDEAVAVAA